MAVARIPFITDEKKKKLKKIKNPSRMPMKLSSWFSSKKKEKPTVGKKVGQETLNAIQKRKKEMDELMNATG